jgi:phytoene synthase
MSGRDTSFYYSFLVLPAEQRRAIIAVWDFCRAVDDSVDVAGGAAALDRWKAELDRVYATGAGPDGGPQTSQGLALQHWVRRFNLTRWHFDAVLAGVEMDLAPRRYETMGDLREYAERVASAVGLMCLEIFGVRDGSADRYAHELGVALQLTNILRDVPEDLAAGRIYLTVEDQRAAGVTDEMLRASVASRTFSDPRVRDLLARHGAHARAQFARVTHLFPWRKGRKLVAAEIMKAVYRRLLDKIEARGFDVFRERVTVPRPERARVALGVYLRTLAGLHHPRK